MIDSWELEHVSGSCRDDVGATPPENFGITSSQYMDGLKFTSER